MALNPRLAQPTIEFEDETRAEAIERYRGFGIEVLSRLDRLLVEGATRLKFFRDPSTNDLWSFYDDPKHAFGLQLDPYLEVICLWDDGESIEIGTWSADPIEEALEWIRNRVDRSPGTRVCPNQSLD